MSRGRRPVAVEIAALTEDRSESPHRSRRPTRTSAPAAARGFTLIEVMVALAILGMVSATVFMSLAGALDSIERVRKAQEPYQRGRVGRSFIASSIRSTTLFSGIPGDGFVAVDSSVGAIPRDELTWISGTPPGSGSARMQLHLFVADSGGTPSLRIGVRPITSGDSLPAAEVYVLSRAVTGLDIEYLAAPADERSVWNEKWDSRIRVPHAVRIDFIPAPVPDPIFSTPLLVQIPAGRIL